jgi:hypothetical protein
MQGKFRGEALTFLTYTLLVGSRYATQPLLKPAPRIEYLVSTLKTSTTLTHAHLLDLPARPLSTSPSRNSK